MKKHRYACAAKHIISGQSLIELQRNAGPVLGTRFHDRQHWTCEYSVTNRDEHHQVHDFLLRPKQDPSHGQMKILSLSVKSTLIDCRPIHQPHSVRLSYHIPRLLPRYVGPSVTSHEAGEHSPGCPPAPHTLNVELVRQGFGAIELLQDYVLQVPQKPKTDIRRSPRTIVRH